MTATITESVSGSTQGGVGRVARVIGPVVDVEFPANQIPDIYNALTAELTIGGKTRTVTFEVALHLEVELPEALVARPREVRVAEHDAVAARGR